MYSFLVITREHYSKDFGGAPRQLLLQCRQDQHWVYRQLASFRIICPAFSLALRIPAFSLALRIPAFSLALRIPAFSLVEVLEPNLKFQASFALIGAQKKLDTIHPCQKKFWSQLLIAKFYVCIFLSTMVGSRTVSTSKFLNFFFQSFRFEFLQNLVCKNVLPVQLKFLSFFIHKLCAGQSLKLAFVILHIS